MVRAILEGSKTQTRRIIKPQPVPVPPDGWENPTREKKHDAPYFDAYCNKRKSSANPRGMSQNWCWWDEWDRQCLDQIIKCPYGVPGDRLWVRETWSIDPVPFSDGVCPTIYRVDVDNEGYTPYGKWVGGHRWTPSIHMPRWASRINLLIKNIRVERLQDIFEEDAKAEGVTISGGWNADETSYGVNYAGPFSHLWNSINGKRPGCTWTDNPYVWVVEFQRV